jgi:hypothetical protein
MKEYFPFTDYDFYAYLTAGAGFLFAVDLTFYDGAFTRQSDWTFIKIVLVIALAYVIGQLTASVSSIVLEHLIARRLLHPPFALQLGLSPARARERFVSRFLVGRYYEALPELMRAKVLDSTARALGVSREALREGEEVFQHAFPIARRSKDVVARLNDFLKLYGLNRNLSFVALTAAFMFLVRAVEMREASFVGWGIAAAAIGFGCFVRFLKFYAAYSAEVLRGYIEGSSKVTSSDGA